jgi:hypothetical protein
MSNQFVDLVPVCEAIQFGGTEGNKEIVREGFMSPSA